MIIHTEATVRTDVENVFLKEMVTEDNQFLVLGECNELDYMVDPDPSSSGGLFDDSSEDDEYLSIDIDDIMNDEDDSYLFDDFV